MTQPTVPAPFEADYSNDVAITVHAAGCAHQPKRGKSRQPLNSADLATALVEAQYQGRLEPSEEWDLGLTKAAPCARRIGV
jgi:hypothetical protein